MDQLLALLKKHREFLLYALFGCATTLSNYAVYLPLYNFLHVSGTLSNAIAWVASVAVAFLTNKPFVFESHDWSFAVTWPELCKFVGCRLGSGLLETAAIFLFVDVLQWNGNILKLITSIMVIILNYIGSKWLVFGKH